MNKVVNRRGLGKFLFPARAELGTTTHHPALPQMKSKCSLEIFSAAQKKKKKKLAEICWHWQPGGLRARLNNLRHGDHLMDYM